jgi:hypothetical protein
MHTVASSSDNRIIESASDGNHKLYSVGHIKNKLMERLRDMDFTTIDISKKFAPCACKVASIAVARGRFGLRQRNR